MRRQIEVGLELAEALPPVVGHEARIRAAVLALVLNAIDASPPAGRVTLATSATPGEVALAVADDGDGISEADRARLFEPFFSTRPQGLGLGLVACRAVAEAQGGSVEFGARPGRGSCFTLRLPLASREPVRQEGRDSA